MKPIQALEEFSPARSFKNSENFSIYSQFSRIGRVMPSWDTHACLTSEVCLNLIDYMSRQWRLEHRVCMNN